MKQDHIQVITINDVVALQITRLPSDSTTVILLLSSVEAAIAKYREEQRLVARKRTIDGCEGYWIGRGKGSAFALYRDARVTTGYVFKSKTKAEQIIGEIEARLAKEEEARKRR